MVWGFGFWVWGLGFWVWGLRLGDWGLGFRIWSLGWDEILGLLLALDLGRGEKAVPGFDWD